MQNQEAIQHIAGFHSCITRILYKYSKGGAPRRNIRHNPLIEREGLNQLDSISWVQ
jgi:hypothetical protein